MKKMDEQYLALVHQFPLLPLSNESEHKAAKKMIDSLIERDDELIASEIGYGKILAQIIENYEREILQGFFQDSNGHEALQYLLQEHRLMQTQAAEIAGVSKKKMHDFLKGRRSLPRDARTRLAVHFKLHPEVFELVKHATSA